MTSQDRERAGAQSDVAGPVDVDNAPLLALLTPPPPRAGGRSGGGPGRQAGSHTPFPFSSLAPTLLAGGERPSEPPEDRDGKGLLYVPELHAAPSTDRQDWTPADLWQPSFPSSELVSTAADMLARASRWDGREGPRWHVTVGPGIVAIGSTDRAKQERTEERESLGARRMADLLAAHLNQYGEFPDDLDPQREITGWSRKSRARMVRVLCELDYAPLFSDTTRLLAMVTLTYPGDWLAVAPNGKAVKRHMRTFLERYYRAWGERFVGVWKLEFQRRGAPHLHVLCRPPQGTVGGQAFRAWLSSTWAAVVDHPDAVERMKHELAGTAVDWNEGLRSTDPRRVAVYFTKHGAFAAKEYQHCVPRPWQEPGQGPGRFWGYWGLSKATKGVEVSPRVAVEAARLVRRWAKAQGTTRQVRAPRVNRTTGELRYRNVRRRVKRMKYGRGWVSVNDGPAFASQMARWLSSVDRA